MLSSSNTLEVLDICPQKTGFIFSRRQRHLYWPHSETSLKTQSLRGKMHATWPGVYWIGRVFGSSVGTATGDRLTRRQGIFVKNWDEMSWNEMKKEMKCAKQIKSNTMSCSVLGSLVSCSPHLLKAPRTLKVYLSVGEEARPLIDCFSTFCEIVDNVTLLPFCSKTVVLWALWSCHSETPATDLDGDRTGRSLRGRTFDLFVFTPWKPKHVMHCHAKSKLYSAFEQRFMKATPVWFIDIHAIWCHTMSHSC